MSAVLVDLGTHVVQHINTGTYSQSVTAERHYSPLHSLETLTDLKVTVTPRSLEIFTESRGLLATRCRVEVMIQKRLPDTTTTSVDPLVNLSLEIADRLLADDQPGFHACRAVEVQPAFAGEHLDEFRLFTCLLTAVYDVWRSHP